MTKAERERRHQASLEAINRVQLVAGKGDCTRVDHEGTLLERARMFGQEISGHRATEAGIAALDRLLRLAENRKSAQRGDVIAFIAAVRDGKALPLAALRGLDSATGDDMLAVLDAFRHARLNLVEQVPGGPRRVARILGEGSLADA